LTPRSARLAPAPSPTLRHFPSTFVRRRPASRAGGTCRFGYDSVLFCLSRLLPCNPLFFYCGWTRLSLIFSGVLRGRIDALAAGQEGGLRRPMISVGTSKYDNLIARCCS
ncbi:unnamed protein product, partial [Scytosiphon promiscuus]